MIRSGLCEVRAVGIKIKQEKQSKDRTHSTIGTTQPRQIMGKINLWQHCRCFVCSAYQAVGRPDKHFVFSLCLLPFNNITFQYAKK